MGRLPETFAGTSGAPQRITFRTPYIMSASIDLDSSTSGAQFAPDVFTHSVDRPFEIHRMIPRAYTFDSTPEIITTQPDISLLMGCITTRILDFGKTQNFNKASTQLMNLVKGPSELTWEYAEPYYLVKDEGLIVSLDSVVYPFTNDTVKVDIAFEGFLLTLAPASERR